MTAAEAVETSLTKSLSQDYTNLDDLLSPTCTDYPGFKPFTLLSEIFKDFQSFIILGKKFEGR